MPARCTYASNFEHSSNGTLPVRAHLCGPYRGPTSKGGRGIQHRQWGHTVPYIQPHKIVRSPSVPTSWHHASIPPNLCRNPKHALARHNTHHIWNLMDCKKFLFEFLHYNGQKPPYEFLEQHRFDGCTKLGHWHLTRRQTNPIQRLGWEWYTDTQKFRHPYAYDIWTPLH